MDSTSNCLLGSVPSVIHLDMLLHNGGQGQSGAVLFGRVGMLQNNREWGQSGTVLLVQWVWFFTMEDRVNQLNCEFINSAAEHQAAQGQMYSPNCYPAK